MKNFLTTTAVALVIANGAFAQTDATAPATDGTSNDSASVDSTGGATTTTVAPADPAVPAADGPATDGTSNDSMAVDSTGAATTTTTVAPADAETPASEAPATDGTSNDSASVQNAAPAMEMDGYATVMVTEIPAEQLTGTTVYGTDDVAIGQISDIVMADGASASAFIVDVGGFLGMGANPVAIPVSSVQVISSADGTDMRAYVSFTADQLKAMPINE